MKTRGQTLFELVVAIGIGVLIVTAIVRLVTISVRNSTFSKNKAEAARYSQETLEWLRAEKERDWGAFYGRSADPTYWCLASLSWPSSSGQCGQNQTITGTTLFTRLVALDRDDVDQDGTADDIEAIVTVTWTESGQVHSSTAATHFGDIQ